MTCSVLIVPLVLMMRTLGNEVRRYQRLELKLKYSVIRFRMSFASAST